MPLTLLGAGSGTRIGTLILDRFTDSSGTALTTHTPDRNTAGGGWVAGIGTWDIEANRAELAVGAGSYNTVRIDSGSSRYRINCDLFTGTKAYSGFIVRAASSNSNIEVELALTENEVQIVRNDGGVRTAISTGGDVAANTLYAVKIDVTTATIECSLNGSTVVSVSTNFNQAQTNVGLCTWDIGSSGSYWDNFQVLPL